MELEYLTDKQGHHKAVVVPIDIWKKIISTDSPSIEELTEGMEDYCLNKAMDEAKYYTAVGREEALKFLEEEN